MDFTRVDGLGVLTVQIILSEVGLDPSPVLSLSENNNRSETLEPLSNQTLSFSFLIETKISSQKLKSKARKAFRDWLFPV